MQNDKKIPIRDLKEVLEYFPDTGKLLWRHRCARLMPNDGSRRSWNTKYAGKEAFGIEHQGYRAGRVLGVNLKGHRVAWAIHYGAWPVGEVDHINGNRADNRIENLRDVTRAENRKNLKRQRNNTSGVVGVSLHRALGFAAYIKVGGENMHLGYYANLEDAAAVRRDAEKRFGFHANHGRLV